MGIVLKILLVVGVVLALVWALRGRGRQPRKPVTPQDKAATAHRAAKGAPQEMVTCARCGVHLPASEAVGEGTRRYCSADHRDADQPA